MNDQPVTALVILIVFSLVGFSAIYIAIVGGLESKKRFERERTHVTGRIVELIPRKDRFGRQSINTFWYPVVSFMVDGRERRVESRDAFSKGDFAEGDEVEIRYDADDPSHFHIEQYSENDRRSSWFITWFGIACLIVAAAAAILSARMV